MTRATPMPPEERRASLIEATLPLLLEHGPGLTTKQVAEAAGVAEGTIFRVFPSLSDLIDATTLEALSSQRLKRDIETSSPGDSLLTKSVNAIELFNRRMTDVRNLLHAVHQRPQANNGCLRDELDLRRQELEDWLTAEMEPHAVELRVDPRTFVHFLRTLALGNVFSDETTRIDSPTLATLALQGAGKAN